MKKKRVLIISLIVVGGLLVIGLAVVLALPAIFKGFGDNSLDFELRVYIKGIDNWWPMLHELNVAIDNAFKEAGVTIAFPQRDVHLDATGPLAVRVVSEPSGSEAGKRLSAVQKKPDE